jgi:DNA-binding winged helix-turn-helix (wHTH) protein
MTIALSRPSQRRPPAGDFADPDSAGSGFLFGPFRLFPSERLLTESGKPLRLGSRALEILIVLVERAGDLVSKNELMARVWPATNVVEDNLSVHVAALRRTLGDGKGGHRYIITIPGRGYCFVARVTQARDLARPAQLDPANFVTTLPTSLTRLIGRGDSIAKLVATLPGQRLLAVAGPGGIGKTSVALAVAEVLAATDDHGICMVDLAELPDSRLAPGSIAAALGLENSSAFPLPRLMVALSEKQMLLLLDTCEHVIGAAAELAVGVLRHAPGVQILATGRG